MSTFGHVCTEGMYDSVSDRSFLPHIKSSSLQLFQQVFYFVFNPVSEGCLSFSSLFQN